MRALLWCLAALVAAKKSRLSDTELAKVVRRSQQSRPATCDDSRTFKSRLGDVSCKVLRKTSEPRRSELCGSAINWQGKAAAAACPKACRVCQYHEFVNGTLSLSPPERPRLDETERQFVNSWWQLGVRHPIARTVIFVDQSFVAEYAKPRYDALYVEATDAGAARIWAKGGASLLVRASVKTLPFAAVWKYCERPSFAERAADFVVANAAAPRAAELDDDGFLAYVAELARITADDGVLVLLRLGVERRRLVDRWLRRKMPLVDVCSSAFEATRGNFGLNGSAAVARCRRTGRGCVRPAAILRPAPPFTNVYSKRPAPIAVERACRPDRGCTRFTRGDARTRTIADPTRQALVLREAPVGRLRYWDEGRVVSGYDGVWASRYRKEHGQAWHEIYVGNHGFMPDKREWPGALEALVRSGKVKSILDAGAGTCSLDAHLRKHGLRSRVRLVAFGFYDCSMARVASERGSLIFDWSWLDPLPFCQKCTFDVVFQAEGIHHTVPRKTADRLDEFCPKARRRLTVRNRFELKQQLARRHKNMFNEHQKQTPAERKAALQAPDACALKLWQVAFDNLGRHVKCGGVLFITDLLGDVFTGSGPRCWPEFGRRWMVENGFEHVRRQTGDPCGNHYPFLFLRRKC